MKNTIFFVFFILFGTFFLSIDVNAQSTGSKREVGLQFGALNLQGAAFSAFYKKERKENVYRRIRFVSGDIDLGLREETTDFNFAAGLAIGREKRKSLDDKLLFYQGPEFSFRVAAFTISEDDLALQIRPSFGWVIGLQHSFNDRWAINIETIPNFYATALVNDQNEGLYFGVGGSNTMSLGLVRKF